MAENPPGLGGFLCQAVSCWLSRGGFAGAESRALSKPEAIAVPEERSSEASGSGGPGRASLPLGFGL